MGFETTKNTLDTRFIPEQQSSGYSLVELIAVVLVLGLIVAALVPQFINLSEDAELEKINATAGAFQTAVKQVQVNFNAQGFATRVQNLPNFGAGNVDTNNIGFPIGIDKGNGNENIGRGNAGCVGVWNGILSQASTVDTNNSAEFQSFRHTGSRVCSYVYRAGGDTAGRNAARLVIQYDSRDGQVYVCGTQSGLSACPF